MPLANELMRQTGTPDGANATEGACPPDEVRLQLSRILASSVFRNSKRYASMLKYVVDATLDGHSGLLKERTIGVEVFEKPSDYNTASDHVVRSAGSEVRRRLASYYQEPGHENELRLDLLAGSYVPQFRLPSPPAPHAPAASTTSNRRPLIALAFCAGVAIALLVPALGRLRPTSTMDRFWAPTVSGTSSVLLCIGNDRRAETTYQKANGAGTATVPTELRSMTFQVVSIEDAVTLARLAGVLQSRGKAFRVVAEPSTSIYDLRERTAVLIGSLNNDWSMRLGSLLRFRFERGDAELVIRDSANPQQQVWTPMPSAPPAAGSTKDFGIVARFRDRETGQWLILAAGTHAFGTTAAGELISNPEYIRQLDAKLPRGWDDRNIEVVFTSEAIRGAAGPPTVIATHVW